MRLLFVAAATACGLMLAADAVAQVAAVPPTSPSTTQTQTLMKVFIACEGCDLPALQKDVAFVEYVTDKAQAAVDVTIAAGPSENTDKVWVLTFTGRETFAGQDRKLTLALPASAGAPELRTGLARHLKFGLVEYAAKSEIGSQLDVAHRALEENEAKPAQGARDPWNYWVYRLNVNAYSSGEVSSGNTHYSGGASASRVTEAWKMNFGVYRSKSTSRFQVSDELEFLTDESDWSFDSLIVKSLGPHWSAGITGGASSSTYSNQKLRAQINPAIEYDIFPYAESSKRSLTLQYSIGPARYEYHQVTIFDKLEETVWRQSLQASFGLRQPWGNASASASFSQLLNAADKNRVSIYGSLSVRLFRGLSVNGSASYSRIRDQFYLEKQDASPEEILLRLRQLATGYSYSASFGFSYSFGSLSNATVNPRFGG